VPYKYRPTVAGVYTDQICLTILEPKKFTALITLNGMCKGLAGLERKNSSENDDVSYYIYQKCI
jgi:hypothetical protein